MSSPPATRAGGQPGPVEQPDPAEQSSGEAEPASRRSLRRKASFWPGPGAEWFTMDRVLAIVVPVLLIAIAMAPLEPVYLNAWLFVAIGGGLILGTAIAVVGAMLRWHTLTVLAVALPAFFLCGALAVPSSAIASIVPTPTTWQLMGRGLVTVWKQVLTISPPLGTGGALMLLPYLMAFVGALVAVTISLRAKYYSLCLILPALILIASILFGTRLSVLAGTLGVTGVLVSLSWVSWRAGRLELNRVLAVSVVLGVAAVGSTGASLVLVPNQPRLVLRDFVEPPPDPHDYPSPLAGYRYYVDDLDDRTVFTISGVPAGTEAVRLAAMDSYDGMVWDVTPGHTPATGSFTRTGDRITIDVPDDAVEMVVSIQDMRGVWLPNIGDSVDLTFTSSRASRLTENFYYNTATDTALNAAGLDDGDSYTLVAQRPDPPSDLSATRLVADNLSLPEPRNVPDIIGTLASQYAEGYSNDYARVESIASNLSNSGFFSNGLVNEVPSRPGHGAGRIADMLDAEEIVGNEEQYAAAMALMVRALGYPSRVVMGFEVEPAPDGAPQEIKGEDVTAWVEVPFEGQGWLPFYPTPPEDQIPQAEDPDPVDRPQPQVLQPPPPPVEPPDVPPQDRSDAEVQEEGTEDEEGVGQWLLIGAAVGVPLLLLLSPFLIIAALKVRRRRKRRTTGAPEQRIAGGWVELEDQAVDLGRPRASGLTRRESAATLDSAFEGAQTLSLARAADAGVFAPAPPPPEEAERYWQDVHSARSRMRHSVRRRQRFRSTFSPRSLRR